MRCCVFAIALNCGAFPALAETIHCADAGGEVSIAYDVGREAGRDTVMRVEMQITDDFGISTDPTHEDYSGEDIAEQAVTGRFTEVVLRVGGGLPSLILRLADGDEGDRRLRAGVLSVAGGGVWAVQCEVPD